MAKANGLNVDTTATAWDMADAIFGDGVTVTNATYTGAATASGTYTGGRATLGDLTQSDTVVILATGHVTDFTNSSGTKTASDSAPEIDAVEGNTTSHKHFALESLSCGGASDPLPFDLQNLSPGSSKGGGYPANNDEANAIFCRDGRSLQTDDVTTRPTLLGGA